MRAFLRFAICSFALTLPLISLSTFAFGQKAEVEPELELDPATKDRKMPPPGILLKAADRERLESELAPLEKEIAELKAATLKDKKPIRHLANAEIYSKAVRYALLHNEFFDVKDIAKAEKQIKLGKERLELLKASSDKELNKKSGLLVRGYYSRIDNSPIPYGLEVPKTIDTKKARMIVIWLHGRNEKLTDMNFIADRMNGKCQFQFDNTIILHSYGRMCNAYKFAGEGDVFEGLQDVIDHYELKDAPVVLMGFSMGGAACWHLAAHYPDSFVAASPGAGFVDTERYQKLRVGTLPPWYEQQLWAWYDVPPCTRNLFNFPILSYSGEIDPQKASADIMEEEFAKHGQKLHRVIGKNMPHKYDKASIDEITKWVEEQVANRKETSTKSYWQTSYLGISPWEISAGSSASNPRNSLAILRMNQSWRDARIDVEIDRKDAEQPKLVVTTSNVKSLAPAAMFNKRLDLAVTGDALSADQKGATKRVNYIFDGTQFSSRFVSAFNNILAKAKGEWTEADEKPAELHKTQELCGPIDHAFVKPFIFVAPTGKSKNEKFDQWVKNEMEYQRNWWRIFFRGEIRVVNDDKLTQQELVNYNLILWGDSDSNQLIKKFMPMVPDSTPGKAADTKDQILVGVFPKPNEYRVIEKGRRQKTPKTSSTPYFVLNTGMTFSRQYSGSNALQTPKLPDWALLDISNGPVGNHAGRVVSAGFFDEDWKFVDPEKQKTDWEKSRQGK